MDEDRCLTDFLVEMDCEGKLKSEGGFKTGYLAHLERVITLKLPDSGLKEKNIDSRLTYLKRQFFTLHEIKEKGSGFGWDDKIKMVTGDIIVFDEWAQSHVFAKGLYRKPWILYDDFEELFAKDRATGINAAFAADREQQQEQFHGQSLSFTKENRNSVHLPTHAESSQNVSKKRKVEQIENAQTELVKVIEMAIKSENDQVAQILNMVAYEPKVDKTHLREELCQLSGLNMVHVVQGMYKMTTDDVDTLYALQSGEEKCAFVQVVLRLL